MRILLDESLPRKLKNDFNLDNEVFTVRDMGWLGKKNGELLKLMIENQFDYFVTVDRNLPYQQNIERLPLTIFVLCAYDNRRETLSRFLPYMFQRISLGNLQNVIEIWE
jgi:hypothetical protein